jgi:hypothetical protein
MNVILRSILALSALAGPGLACELCAIYNSSNALEKSGRGFLFTVAEQFISSHTTQLNGEEVRFTRPDYLDSSITHLVPGYNFSQLFGVSLNTPIVYRSFQRTDLRYSLTAPPVLFTEKGTEFGLGDLALIGRMTLFRKTQMKQGWVVNLLAGIKFPTGNTDRLKDEVEQARIFDSFVPPGTQHDPLGHSISGVHQSDISPGSGSFDGILGMTVNARWEKWIFNTQVQYYLRTEGESSFQYGDELMVSGGPGRYLLLRDELTLSLQVNAAYETEARDHLLGRESDQTGQSVWYLGPQLNLTWGRHSSANLGVDVPLLISNNGLQIVPDYRVHAGLTWQF